MSRFFRRLRYLLHRRRFDQERGRRLVRCPTRIDSPPTHCQAATILGGTGALSTMRPSSLSADGSTAHGKQIPARSERLRAPGAAVALVAQPARPDRGLLNFQYLRDLRQRQLLEVGEDQHFSLGFGQLHHRLRYRAFHFRPQGLGFGRSAIHAVQRAFTRTIPCPQPLPRPRPGDAGLFWRRLRRYPRNCGYISSRRSATQ